MTDGCSNQNLFNLTLFDTPLSLSTHPAYNIKTTRPTFPPLLISLLRRRRCWKQGHRKMSRRQLRRRLIRRPPILIGEEMSSLLFLIPSHPCTYPPVQIININGTDKCDEDEGGYCLFTLLNFVRWRRHTIAYSSSLSSFSLF